MTLRDARPGDLADLAGLEVEGFPTDRLSSRSMRRLLSSPSARLRVLSSDGSSVDGYHLTLFRRGSRIARLYSLVVAPHHRGKGVAQTLLADAEALAARQGARALRLEVRADNARAIRFYTRLGYRRIGARPQYYADKATALRYEKLLPVGESARPADAAEDRSPLDIAAGATQEAMTGIELRAAPDHSLAAEG
jgi:[ribosomal protein S18]-alanine N-acetyltransferase